MRFRRLERFKNFIQKKGKVANKYGDYIKYKNKFFYYYSLNKGVKVLIDDVSLKYCMRKNWRPCVE